MHITRPARRLGVAASATLVAMLCAPLAVAFGMPHDAGAVVAPAAAGLPTDDDAGADRGHAVDQVPGDQAADQSADQAPGADAAPTAPAPAPDFTGDATVHLTFDDGPGGHTDEILDILAAKGVHATFYVVGDRAQRWPDTTRRIVAEGHRLANHTRTHPVLTRIAPDQVAAEIASTQDILTEITGTRPTAFRPPYGATDDVVRAAAAAQDVSVDLWTIDTEDWRAPGADVVRDRVLTAAEPGSVVLMHVLRRDTVEALPQIIDGLRALGHACD